MSFMGLAGLLLLVVLGGVFLLRKPAAKTRPRAAPAVPQHSPGGAPPTDAAEAQERPQAPVPDALARFALLDASALDEEAAARVDTLCAAMPEPEPVQLQIATGLDDPEELMRAVISDAGLTADILRTVNSAAFALETPISSVQHAITYLGVAVVKGLVLRASTARRAQGDGVSPDKEAALARIWQSACVASAMAQMLGQELAQPRPSVLATQALFFNLGDVALVHGLDAAPAWYADGVSIVERIAAQQQACGANSAIVGGAIARRWGLPGDLATAIDRALLPLVTAPDDHPLTGDERAANVLVYLSSRIGDRVTYRGLASVADLDLEPGAEAGLYYLAGHLQAAGLGRAPALLKDAAFRRKADRLLQSFSG
jgi:HD-like signal output (HDOD) protein